MRTRPTAALWSGSRSIRREGSTRATPRDGWLWRWDAWVLFPHEDGPWFWLERCVTRAGALRAARRFLVIVERQGM